VTIRFLIPNLITAGNLSLGFCSLLMAAAGHFELAVYMLVGCVVLDLLDGRVARLLKATSSLGQQLDSFSDALSFGAAPAFLVNRAVLQPLGRWGLAVSVVYLLAGTFRLARFNLTTDAHTKARRTTGVPIPVAAGYMLAVVLMREQIPVGWVVAVVLLLAGLMASRVPLPEFKATGLVGAAFLIGLATYLAVVVRPSWLTVAVWNLWNCVILVTALAVERRDTGRRRTRVSDGNSDRHAVGCTSTRRG
jgi:CDP-diacylglycerol---serine O-phosphatidyltransferase